MTEEFYLWLKAIHVIAAIAWMAALLYLPRLFVYHCEAAPGSQASEMLKVMERRLLRIIATPAMVATLLFGVLLLWPRVVDWSEGWLHAKLVLVVGLAAIHGMMARWWRDFAEDRNRRSRRFYRVANEVPTLLMVVIVVLVVVKPF